ncbi:Protein DGCR6L [Oopsacas minuta]|uniref:Protein DGCR6L n=1 Tax=Oopsacas minuta TaxID=111878 RepID=A0AAV7K955_9METZ|nr:Protein DGCR6L [Oopsacas minuta]
MASKEIPDSESSHSNISVMTENSPKLDQYLKTLNSIKGELSEPISSHLTEERLYQLATSLLDGTVFEIIKELEEIQSLTEEQLLQQRMKVATSHKKKQTELNQQLKEGLRKLDGRQHHEIIVRRNYDEAKQKLEKMSQDEMTAKDKEIIRELDKLLEEQQSVLEQAAVPTFCVTNQKESIKLQMGVLEVIQRVGAELGVSGDSM